jgi:hypothetical protein
MARRTIRRLLGPRLTPAPGRLHVCPDCGGDYVNPTSWDVEGRELWRVGLRCGGCGYERETVIGPELAEIFDRALDKGFNELTRTAERVERDNMTAWVDSFSTALQRDLIEPSDF